MTPIENDKTPVVLLAEDIPAEQQLVRRAIEKAGLNCELHIVNHGEEAIEFLYRRGEFTDAPRPDLFLLDLNMPRMDGRQVLEQVKSDPSTSSIPIVILTTAQHDEDIARCYALGCNSYVVKPMDLHDFIHLLSVIGDYWFNIVMRSC